MKHFVPDNENYIISENNSGEAILCLKATVTFEPGDEAASGSMKAVELAVGSEYKLPDCDFTAPEGMQFKEWSVVIGKAKAVTKAAGDPITVTADTVVTALWKELPVATIKGVTGSFNDKIKLNYYFDFPAELLEDPDAYVTITEEERKTDKTITLSVADADFETGKGYKFSIELAAKEASDTITARVFDGKDNPVTVIGWNTGNDYTGSGVQYSMMQYFTWLEDEESSSTDEEKDLGAAAKDYCSAAQIYFEYHADGLSVSSAVNAVTEETLNKYKAGSDGELPAGVSIKGISAMLESDNTFRLYLNFENDDLTGHTFKIDGNPVEIKTRSDGLHYLALNTGVFANHLQDPHTYTVSDGKDTCTITASVLTYARTCALRTNKVESNLGKALCLYNRAVYDVFGE